MLNAGRASALSAMRQRIERIERKGRPLAVLPFRVPEIDRHLPGGGLALGAVHEVMQAGRAGEHAAAATLFVAGVAARNKGEVLWCLRHRDLFAPALAGAGLLPDRVIYAEARREADLLTAMEDGLRQAGLAAVVGEVGRLGLTGSRRLQLAAEESGVPALVLRRWRNDAEQASGSEPTAAVTRWRISAASSRALPTPGVGRARWHVELVRCRGGEPRSWLLESPDAKGRLAVPADVADGPLPQERRRRAAA